MTAQRDLKPVKKRDHARLLSASVIGAAALAIVGGVGYVQMKQGESPSPFTIDNPAPPPDLAQAEAARAAAEKRLAEAMSIQIVNIPSASTQASTASQPAPSASPLERPTPPSEQLARAEPPPVTPPPALIMPTAPSSMSAAEQEALLNRVSGLLKQGDIGAARAVLNRLVRENNSKAAFILAQSYDPMVLRHDGVVGMRGDPELARTLYEQALRGGVTEAKAALDTLAQAN